MKFKVLNEKLELNPFDPDVMACIENEVAKTAGLIRSTVKDEKASDTIRRQCNAVIECVDNIFGEGSSQKVLGEKTDLIICIDAFEDICFIQEQMAEILDEKKNNIRKRLGKYSASRALRTEENEYTD